MSDDKKDTKDPDIYTEEEIQAIVDSDGFEGDTEFMLQVLNMAKDSSIERIEAIDKALAEKNNDEVWRTAHAIKSTCLMGGLKVFEKAAVDVERAFRGPVGDDEKNRDKFIETIKYEAKRLIDTVNYLNAKEEKEEES